MIFERSFHFYAAHRNQHLEDRCAGLHGHRYQVEYQVEVHRRLEHGFNVSTLFSDFDPTEASWKRYFDHALLLDSNDPITEPLLHLARTDTMRVHWRVRQMDMPTSVENLTFVLFRRMELDLLPIGKLLQIKVRETDSTALIYDAADFRKDLSRFQPSKKEKNAEPATPTDEEP